MATDRQIGMVAGPIPKASIDRHVDGWHHDEADLFRACIRRMDSEYLAFEPGKPTDEPEMSPQDRLTKIFGDRIN